MASEKNIALFSDNSPTVSWVTRLASKRSHIGEQLIQALTLRLKDHRCCPLTPLHVAGKRNRMADMASRSFGSEKKWHHITDLSFVAAFNTLFPLPAQNFWTAFRLTSTISTRVISILQAKRSTLEEWRRIPKIGDHIGITGAATLHLWGWIQASNAPDMPNVSSSFPGLRPEIEQATTAESEQSKLHRSLQLSWPLARRSHWNMR